VALNVRLDAIAKLCCPECRGTLRVSERSEAGDGTLREGSLACSACTRSYAVVKGIPILLPDCVPNAAEREIRRRVSQSTELEDWCATYDRHHFRALMELELERLTARRGPLQILDIGVGWGPAYLPVARQTTLWGLDFSFESLLLMQRLYAREGAPEPMLVCASLTAIPLRDLRFDLVRSVQVYQHLRERSEIRRSFAFVIEHLLAPGGAFVVENLSYEFSRTLVRLRRLLRRAGREPAAKEEQTSDFFLRRYEPADFIALLPPSAVSRSRITFTETLFHPGLGATPRSRTLAHIDAALARSPLARRLGRQVRLTVTANG
jgi:uncharacterized protein YbaR (Trm112 family)